MEWHKAKNIMLALLILVNLILLGSRGYMAVSDRREQQAAAEGVCAYLDSLGIGLDVELIPAKSPGRRLCVIPRDRAAEAAFAALLLTDAQRQSGGSSDRYVSDTGELVWRHGGAVECTSPYVPASTQLRDMLDGCCLDGDVLMQEIDGMPVFNCRLTIAEGEGLTGRWCFGEPALLDEEVEMSAAGLLIAYGASVKDDPPAAITAVEYGYVVESVPNVGVRLVPVLRMEADGEDVVMNALDGEILVIE